MLKVGDTIYRFDIKRRVYDLDAEGRAHGAPIYCLHFQPFDIGAETPRSWLVSYGYGDPVRVNKKTMISAGVRGFGEHQWFTAEGMADNIWHNVHWMPISDLMRGASADQLREIGKILGYDPNKE